MSQIADYNSSTSGQGAFPNYDSATVGNPQVVCQVFTAGSTYLLDGISMWLNRAGLYTPLTGNVRCSIYAAPADEPSGAVLEYAEVAASTILISPNDGWVFFTFAGTTTLTSGTKYAIVVNALNANPTSMDFTNVFYSNNNVTGGLIFSADGEFTWDTTWFATLDCNFRTYKPDPSSPSKATTPAPATTATDVSNNLASLTWVDGGGADTFNVYYGTTSGNLSLVSSNQAGTSFTVTGITNGSPYAYLSTRYWRIDSVNDVGTTTGDEWSFTTLRFDPPAPTGFYVTTGQYYQLLVQANGSYGNPPGVGVENTDFVYLAAGYEANFISTTRKLVAAAENRIWYEDI